MTEDQKRRRAEKKKAWAMANADKMRLYRKNYVRRAALREILEQRRATNTPPGDPDTSKNDLEP